MLALIAVMQSVHSSPKREMRGVWVATVWGIDWPSRSGVDSRTAALQKAELTELLDAVAEMRFTTVCFQVRSMGDVMYQSELEPWSAFLTGQRGDAPKWDPLEFVTEECHRRGLECYAWVNPFRWSTGTDYNTEPDRKWKERGWLLKYGKYTVFNPGLEEVRQHIVNICREIVDGYDVDGLIFDDYFYPNRIPESREAPDYQLYQRLNTGMSIGAWRRANINKLVADVAAMIADTRSGCRFGISPAGVAGKADSSAPLWGVEGCDVKASDWQYAEIFSDPLAWMYQGTVDFVSPQIYWSAIHPTAPFGPLVRWWSLAANQFGTHLYSSLTLERIEQGSRWDNIKDVGARIDSNRAESIDGNQGVMVYSAKFLSHIRGVLETRFDAQALTPEVVRPDGVPVGRPQNLRQKGDVLMWDECSGSPGELMRYTVYAIPPGVSDVEAMDPSGDGLCGDYLLGVAYEPQFTIGRRERGWRYAVCVYTPFSAEGAPSWHK